MLHSWSALYVSDFQGVEHWAANNWYMLFDPLESGLPLLDVSNVTLMTDIYKSAHSGWITIGVVRDPVTRLLSLYFDLVQTLEHMRIEIRNNNCERCNSEQEYREQKRMSTAKLKSNMTNTKRETSDSNILFSRTESYLTWLGITSGFGRFEARRDITIPSIAEVLEALEANNPNTPQAFRPMSTMCGMSKSPFDTIVPFETLQVKECDNEFHMFITICGEALRFHSIPSFGKWIAQPEILI